VIEAAGQAWSVPEAAIGRWLRSAAAEPLASLYDLFPEARQASPHELGCGSCRSRRSAHGRRRPGPTRRRFLPLKPFRGANWEGRWQRIREANAQLKALPPVDLIKLQRE